jgi:predicted dehydrogenase
MDKLGAAVIGCGGIAQVHLSLLHAMPDADIRAVCDILPERARAARRVYGGAVFTDYREMLARPDIDVVHICTPHYLHAPMALDALAMGKRVLCEKPIASEVKDALAMIAADDGRLGVVFQNRYNPPSEMARAIIQEGVMGKLLALRGSVQWHREAPYYAESGWRGTWETEGGGVLINQAIHTIDLMLWLGGTPRSVAGAVSTDGLYDTIEVEDTAHFAVRFEDGKRGIFYATNLHVHDAPVELEMTMEKGALLIRGETLIQRGDPYG